jgi:hypothetical protein
LHIQNYCKNVVLALLVISNAGSSIFAQAPRIPRMPDGKPNLTGLWQFWDRREPVRHLTRRRNNVKRSEYTRLKSLLNPPACLSISQRVSVRQVL